MNVDKLLVNLQKFYWSPATPSSYTILREGKQAGLGTIAHENYGAFNLAFAMVDGRLNSFEEHREAVLLWNRLKQATDLVVDDMRIKWWATLYNEEQFRLWWAIKRCGLVYSSQTHMIDKALGYAKQLPNV